MNVRKERGSGRRYRLKKEYLDEVDPEALQREEENHVLESVSLVTAFAPPEERFQRACAAIEEFHDYFPGRNKIAENGNWVMVTKPPPTEYTVPPMSIWYATPWPMDCVHRDPNRVKILTPRGELGLFPHEYSIVNNVADFYEFIGDGIEIKFFGGTQGVPKDALFYIRSRGIPLKTAITLLLADIRAQEVCWLETEPAVFARFGYKPIDPRALATTTTTEATQA